MRRISLVLATAALGTLLAGCPPTYPNCKSDDNCAEKGEVCVQGKCQECATDGNCKPGFVCDQDQLRCVPKPECTPSGNECGTGKKCEAGKCVVHQCQHATDCPSGNRCEQNRCVPGCTADDDCPSGQSCQSGQCTSAEAQGCSWEPIQFEFNEANLSADAQSRLAQLADCIKRANTRVTLAGHADERGTEEYNLQLSMRRAESTKKYLVTLGVNTALLDTVGFGENRPLVNGSGEDAWARNRRVEFNRK